MIYLDNAATSWPKPPEVIRAMGQVLESAGGNPGRSGHRLSIAAARWVYQTREEIAQFFQVSDPMRVIFTGNATEAINLALKGLLRPGDHVVTTSMEHNALMRPLRALESQGIRLTVVPCFRDGSLDLEEMARAVDGSTRLVAMTHASNVVGTILPVEEACRIAHRAGALFLLDAAQTAGAIPIDLSSLKVDLFAFTGHKELQGPPGIGGLVLGEEVEVSAIEPLVRGGTGSRSEWEWQPDFLPDKFESGTPNLVGIAGLLAGLRWIQERGIISIRSHLQGLRQMLVDGLREISGLEVHGCLDSERSVSIVSFTCSGKRVSEIGMRLDEEYGILARVGLHCAPAAHRTIGSFPEGTVRLAPGILTSRDDLVRTLEAIRKIVGS